MIGIISTKPTNPSKYLIDDECSLLIQARKGEQSDGWGIGYYEKGKLRVFKSPNPVYEEEEVLRSFSTQISSKLIIAHVRKASNPRGLPSHMLIGVENSQPFFYKNYLFVHNGAIYMPDEVAETLGKYKDLIKGVNDSEVYFAYLVKEWETKGDVVEAIEAVERGLWNVLESSEKRLSRPYSSLNAIFSDGVRLYALTLYLVGKDIRSICYEDSEYFRLAYYYDDDILVVASERTNDNEWKLMNNGELLIAELREGKVSYRVLKLNLRGLAHGQSESSKM